MNSVKTYRIAENDFDALSQLANDILAEAQSPGVITLQGDLGAGKTTLVKAFCAVAGIHETVSSPTFTIVNVYHDDQGAILYHIDLYRVEKESDVAALGLEEILYSGSWCFVEWPEIISDILPENFISLKIETEAGTNSRIVTYRTATEP